MDLRGTLPVLHRGLPIVPESCLQVSRELRGKSEIESFRFSPSISRGRNLPHCRRTHDGRNCGQTGGTMKTGRQRFLRVGTGIVLGALLFSGCGGGGGGGEGGGGGSDGSGGESPGNGGRQSLQGFTTARVTLEVPQGTDTSGWRVSTGFLTSETLLPGSSTLSIGVLDSDRQLVWAGTANGRLVLATIKEPGTSSLSLSSSSTAAALVILTPFILPEYLAAPDRIGEWLKSCPETQRLASLIETRLVENLVAITTDPVIQSAISDAWQAALLALHPSSGSQKVTVTERLSSATGADSLEKVGVSDDGILTLRFTNRAGRWVHAYVERRDVARTVVKDVLVPGATMASLVPPALFEPSKVQLQYPIQPYPTNSDVVLKVYGPGAPGSFPWDEWTRLIEPTVFTILEQFIFPIFDIMTGMDLFKRMLMPNELRGKAWITQMVHLLGKAIAEGLKNRTTWWELIPKLVYRTYASMKDDNWKILGEALRDDGLELLADSAAQMAAYFIPVIGQVYGALKISAAVIQIVGSAVSILSSSWVDEYPVRNLPPAVDMTAEPIAGTQNAFKFTARTGYPVLSFEWDFGDGTHRVSDRSGTLAIETKTYAEAKEYTVSVRAKDADGAEGTATARVKVKQLQILTTSLPDGLRGRPYQTTLVVDGLDADVVPQVSVTGGALPGGLGWSGLTLGGTPQAAGDYEFAVTVSAASGSATKSFRIHVADFVITTPSVLPTIVGVTPYSAFLQAAGGTPPYSWRWYAYAWGHHIPLGLSINPSSGVIEGTPDESGTMRFIVEVKDAMGVIAWKEFELTVRPRITSVELSLIDIQQFDSSFGVDPSNRPRIDLVVSGQSLASGIPLSSVYQTWDLLKLFPSLSEGGSLTIRLKVISTQKYSIDNKWYDYSDVNIGVGFYVISKPYPVGWGSSFANWTPFGLGGRLKQGEEQVVSTTLKP